MRISPLADVVIIERQTIKKVGEILIPIDSEDFREDIGTVRYCGEGAVNDEGVRLPMYVKPGNKVLFSTNGHQITKINGEELIVLRQNSIIGIINDDA